MLRKTLAAVLVYTTLGLSFAMAEGPHQGKPPNRGKGGCPPVCFNYNRYYKPMVYAHVTVGNLAYQKQIPSASQLIAEADALMAFANASEADGTMQAAQSALLEPSNIQKFYDTNLTGAQGYAAAAPFGSIISQDTWNGIVEQGTQEQILANKKAFIAQVQAVGLYKIFSDWANALIWYANNYGEIHHHHTRLLNAGYSPGIPQLLLVNWMHAYVDGVALAGTILVLIPGTEPIGTGLLIGAGVVTLYLDATDGWGN